MPHETEILINRLAQQVVAEEEGLLWFARLDADDQRGVLQKLWTFAAQAGATANDVDAAIVRARLKRTLTPCVLLKAGPLKVQAAKVLGLPIAEREKSFRLFLALLQIADERRRSTSCINGCSHWWHAGIQRS
jgi:Family of unknown function (DUF5958)